MILRTHRTLRLLLIILVAQAGPHKPVADVPGKNKPKESSTQICWHEGCGRPIRKNLNANKVRCDGGKHEFAKQQDDSYLEVGVRDAKPVRWQ